jgi:hypothetical protein
VTAKTISILILTCGILGLVAIRAQSRPAAGDKLTESEASRLAREINTAEASLFMAKEGNHQYVSLAQLLESPVAKKHIEIPIALNDAASGEARGYLLSLIASADGKHYLLEVAPHECGPAFFSSDAAVVYPAKALGCP